MRTQDPVNQRGLDVSRRIGETRLGLLKNWEWHDDPRRLLFSLARYKFVAKMFAGRENVLELGCGDAFCAPIVKQTVKRLTVTDFDPLYIEDARSRMREPWVFEALVVDIRTSRLPGNLRRLSRTRWCGGWSIGWPPGWRAIPRTPPAGSG